MSRYRVSDSTRLKQKRGLGDGATYIPWVKAGEFSSKGTCSNPLDWITGRIVHLLSQGEAYHWYILRFKDDVYDIKEQFPLDIEETQSIAKELNIEHPKDSKKNPKYMTTDFLVIKTDGTKNAISVKNDYKSLKQRDKDKIKIEKKYWNEKGIGFELIFKEEMNIKHALNIQMVVQFYDQKYLTAYSDDISVLKHLIANKVIIVDMEKETLNLKKLTEIYRKEIQKWRTTKLQKEKLSV